MLFILLPCTCVRAQEIGQLPPSALELLDAIGREYRDWYDRNRYLQESNLISPEDRQKERGRLAVIKNGLLKRTYQYINAYGFPGNLARNPNVEAEKSVLMRKYALTPPEDSLNRAAIMKKMVLLNKFTLDRIWAQNTLIVLLNTEEDFDQRCLITEIFRFEFETGTLNAAQVVRFLEQTYLILHNGAPLTFNSGTSSAHKLATYAAELDGCW